MAGACMLVSNGSNPSRDYAASNPLVSDNLGDLSKQEDPVKIAVEADAIHADWQNFNSYRTRFKTMKQADGEPVANIEAYINERGIPAQYRGYYRQNTLGVYEEDIKQIPNQWLAVNNSRENLEGVKSYLQHLRAFIDAASSSQESPQALLLTALQAIHADWYTRNSSWTITSGVSATFEGADIETRYNGVRQLYGIAERHGVFDSQPIKEAFNALMTQLRQEKFEPFKSLSVEDAYLAMTNRTGTRPSIIGDPHVYDFYREKVETYPFPSTDSEKEETVLLDFIKDAFPQISGVKSEYFELAAPPVVPGSGARVFLVKDNSRGSVLAALKVQSGSSGLDEVTSVLASESEIPNDSNFRTVKTLAYGKLGNTDDFFLLQEAATVYEADKTFERPPQEQSAMAVKVGASLATLHGKYREFGSENLEDFNADLITFKGNCFYDIRRFNEMLPGGGNDLSMQGRLPQQIESSRARELAGKLKEIGRLYSEQVELKPEQLSPSLTHGDFHGGNIFLTSSSNDARLIDFGGATWFIGKRIGTGDRGNDLGRMVGNIVVEGTKHKLNFDNEIKPLIDQLICTYKAAASWPVEGPSAVALERSVRFYACRFIGINVSDTDGIKFNPVHGESLGELRAKLFSNWQRFLELA